MKAVVRSRLKHQDMIEVGWSADLTDRLEDQNNELEALVSAKREERDNALDKLEEMEREVNAAVLLKC